jgi:hypothetical protein
MANADRPNGFKPVKSLSGRDWNSMIRYIGVADGEDIGIGDMINLESGLADPMATNDAAVLGVAVGFGKVDADGIPLGPYNPADLSIAYYDDSANTHTEWVVYYVPADDVVFEVQTNADLDLVVGDVVDLVDGAVDTTTGRSIQEVGTSTNADFTVVEIPKYPDNDNSLANALVWVMVTRAEQAYH